jgi:hypothetical protein
MFKRRSGNKKTGRGEGREGGRVCTHLFAGGKGGAIHGLLGDRLRSGRGCAKVVIRVRSIGVFKFLDRKTKLSDGKTGGNETHYIVP